MAVSAEAIMRLQDSVSQLVDGAFANHKASFAVGDAPPADYNMLLDAAIEELERRHVAVEPPPPPASSLRTPQPTSGPIADFRSIPILDASRRG